MYFVTPSKVHTGVYEPDLQPLVEAKAAQQTQPGTLADFPQGALQDNHCRPIYRYKTW